MNRTHARFALALAVILSLTAFAQTGRAASSPASPAPAVAPTKIGIINVNGAIIACNEGQRDFEALQKRFDPKTAELKTRNDEIDSLKKQLQTQGDKMNDDARANLVKQVQQKETALKRFVEDTQSEINSQRNELARSIGSKIMKTLDKYARDNGYALVIDYSGEQNANIVWAGQGVDITAPVVDAYNTESGVPSPPKRTGAAAPPAAPSASKPATQPAPTPAKPR